MSNHTWVKDTTFKAERVMRGYTTTERHHCSVCGCERDTTVGYRYKHYSYLRSKILFSERPDCIDWSDRDGLNRIDA
jgi:hypothetical protein